MLVSSTACTSAVVTDAIMPSSLVLSAVAVVSIIAITRLRICTALSSLPFPPVNNGDGHTAASDYISAMLSARQSVDNAQKRQY